MKRSGIGREAMGEDVRRRDPARLLLGEEAMPDHLPLVSVVLNTYNRADMLPQSVESVLSQDYPNFEVIIVDDYSEDNTPEVVASRRSE